MVKLFLVVMQNHGTVTNILVLNGLVFVCIPVNGIVPTILVVNGLMSWCIAVHDIVLSTKMPIL